MLKLAIVERVSRKHQSTRRTDSSKLGGLTP